MKTSAILTASATAATVAAILFFALQTCASGTCGQCRTGAGTAGWWVTDYDGSRRCAQCDGRV